MVSDKVITVKPALGAFADELGLDYPLDSEALKGMADALRGPPDVSAL